MALDQDQLATPASDEEAVTDVTGSAATSTAVDEESLDSSPEGTEAEPEETMGDAIAKALEGESEDEAEAEGGEKPEDDAESKEKTAESAEAEVETEDDGSDVQEGQKIPYQRFKKVIDQRNEWKGKVQTVEQERDQYRQGHEQFSALEGFMQENGLQTQDVVEALQLAALYVNDPGKAAEMLMPKLQTLQRFTGEILPDDLNERVKNGELTEQDAQELVRARNQAQFVQQQSQQQAQTRQQQEIQERAHLVRQSMATAADQTAARLAQNDPDYARKEPFVRRELQALIAERQPQTAQDAAMLVQEAYKNATTALSQFAPRPEVRPGPSSTQGRASTQAAREPQTMAEAIAQAVNSTE